MAEPLSERELLTPRGDEEDVYLDAAQVYMDVFVAGGVPMTAAQFDSAVRRRASLLAFCAAVDAVRAPLLAELAAANAVLRRLRAAHRSAPYRDASGFETEYCLGCDAADGSWPCPVVVALDGGDHG